MCPSSLPSTSTASLFIAVNIFNCEPRTLKTQRFFFFLPEIRFRLSRFSLATANTLDHLFGCTCGSDHSPVIHLQFSISMDLSKIELKEVGGSKVLSIDGSASIEVCKVIQPIAGSVASSATAECAISACA